MGFFNSIWNGIQSVGVKLQNGLQHYAKVGKEVLHKAIQIVRPLKRVALNLKPLGLVGDSLIDSGVGVLNVLEGGLQSVSDFLEKSVIK